MTSDLAILAPLINPWNGVVALATLLVIEVVKSAFPHNFVNDKPANRMLRPLCVLGCAVGYQIDGPWITGDMDPWLRLFVGGLVGAATTIGYAAARSLVNYAGRKRPTTDDADKLRDAIKKWAAVLMALAAAVSGVYGAWFRPESKARDSYELVAEAVELLSADVEALSQQANGLDKGMAVELARMGQRLDDMQGLLELRLQYEPPVMDDLKPVTVETMHVVGEMATMSDEPAPKPEIKRQGMQIQMPSAREVGF